MEASLSRNSSGRLALYREASRLSQALRADSAAALSKLDTFGAQELSDCVNWYCGALDQLNALSRQVDEADRGSETSEIAADCESLRDSIREDLKAAAAFVAPCRAALQRQLSAAREGILMTQERKKLSAYLRSPLIGQDVTHYDRHR
jgi:hypothetical protein